MNFNNKFEVDVVTVANSGNFLTTTMAYNVTFDSTYSIKAFFDNSAFLVYNSTTVLKYSTDFTSFIFVYRVTTGNLIVDTFFLVNSSTVIVI